MRKTIVLWLLAAFSMLCYILLAYHTDRSNFIQLTGLFAIEFLCYGLIIKYWGDNYKLLTAASIAFRFVLLFSLPNLTDDFYRFFWDGTLLSNGENPFLYTPAHYIKNAVPIIPGITRDLFAQLNSPNYFTVYPPVCQYIFWIACTICPENIRGSILVMKCFIILAEMGSVFLIIRLLRSFKLPEKHVLLYALNPLVIIELSGNLHFEAIMIFFLLLSVYLLVRTRMTLSAVAMGVAIGIKLLPFIFLPFLIKGFKPNQFIKYFAVTGSTLVVLFLPFISWEMLINLWQSIDLYFQTFEFNASIYYLVSWFGYLGTGYNIIHIAGPALGLLSLIIILYLATTEKTKDFSILTQAMLLALTVYFVFTTTVHPWYITTLVALTPFTKFRYAIVWSFMVLLSYSAYQTELYQENYFLVWMEYLVVLLWFLFELFKNKKARESGASQ